MKAKMVFLFIVFSVYSTSALMAQTLHSGLAAASGNAAGAGGSASYTIGQVFYNTASGGNGSVAEGVQQPYEISVLSAVKNIAGIDLSYSVFPNPVSEMLILKLENVENFVCTYQLYDGNGKLLRTDKIKEKVTGIDFTELTASVYMLKIIHKNKSLKTFKIIKY